MKAKTLIRAGVVIAVCLSIAAVAALLTARTLNESVRTIPPDGVVFTVERGEYLDSISSRLADEGLIKSPLFLKAVSYLKGTQTDFQVGSYLISPGTTTIGIHDVLVSGREILERVTIPEGWSMSKIAERLDEYGVTSAEAFLEAARDPELLHEYEIPADSAEGFLYPDTYLFPHEFPAERVAAVMIERFFDVIETIAPDYRALDPQELRKKVILASIIEREYRAEDEAAMMASVFYNRLDRNMMLQSCATVAYVMTEELGMEYPEVLTYADLELPSGYNTYRHTGLPPGPIANPGRTALDAVFHPAETEYLYFVLKDPSAGRHEFTRSFDEHLNAKNLYLKQS